MKKGLTEIVFILDRSGSMSGLEADTIGGTRSSRSSVRSQERRWFPRCCLMIPAMLFTTGCRWIR